MCGGRRVFCPGPSPECTMSYSKDTGSILRPWGSLPKPKWNHIRECTRTVTSTHSHVSCSSQRPFLFFHLFRLLSYHVWIDWAEGGSPGKKTLPKRNHKTILQGLSEGGFCDCCDICPRVVSATHHGGCERFCWGWREDWPTLCVWVDETRQTRYVLMDLRGKPDPEASQTAEE